MNNTVIVKQAPPKVGEFKLGLEKYGEKMFLGADSSFSLPFYNGKIHHGLNKEQQKIVENHYGLSFNNPEHKQEWLNMVFTVKHTINAYDPKNNPEDMLVLSAMKQL